MTFFDALAVSMGLSILGMYVLNRWRDAEYVTSEVDGQAYLVQKAEDSMLAANTLARLNDKVNRLIRRLVEKYPEDERVQRLEDRYDPMALSEGGHEAGFTSYSVNKGQKIVMCLRSRPAAAAASKADDPKGTVESENTLMYVLIHELAHISTTEVGHTPKFWENFRFLVKEAVQLGVYRDTDYSSAPVSYCGLKIDSSAVTTRTSEQRSGAKEDKQPTV